MLKFTEFLSLNESFKNLIGKNEDKLKYVDQVWDIIQDSYKEIKGIHGSGFKNKQDMIDNINFWKLSIKGDMIIAVALYKDKDGRKVVAYGTNRSDEGKKKLLEIIKSDLTRSYVELSKATLAMLMKNVPWSELKKFIRTPDEASKFLNKEITPVSIIDINDLEEDAQLSLSKFPQLKDYGYIREIGGENHFKVMFGVK